MDVDIVDFEQVKIANKNSDSAQRVDKYRAENCFSFVKLNQNPNTLKENC